MATLPQESKSRAVLQDAKTRLQAEVKVREFARRHIEAASQSPGVPTIEEGELAPILRLEDAQLREFHLDRASAERALENARGDG